MIKDIDIKCNNLKQGQIKANDQQNKIISALKQLEGIKRILLEVVKEQK